MGARAKKPNPGDEPRELRRRYRAFWVTLFLSACTLLTGLELRNEGLSGALPGAFVTAGEVTLGLGLAGWALVVVRYWQLAQRLPRYPGGRTRLLFAALLASPLFPLVVWHLHKEYVREQGRAGPAA